MGFPKRGLPFSFLLYSDNKKTVEYKDDIKAILKCIWCCYETNTLYIPVYFMYRADFNQPGQAVQYKYRLYEANRDAVRQINDPFLVKFMWKALLVIIWIAY